MLQYQYNYLSIIAILHIYIRINQSFIYHEHCLEDIHRTHPQQLDTIVELDPCSGFSQPYHWES